MSEEIIRETVQKEILNGIKKELDSTLIFTYIQSIEQENKQLKQWDNNKDSRNSRQRIENKKLLEKNKHLQTNWNELKKWLEEIEIYFETEYKATKRNLVYRYYKGAKNAIGDTLIKMSELERGEE